jgi:hypothetical protein
MTCLAGGSPPLLSRPACRASHCPRGRHPGLRCWPAGTLSRGVAVRQPAASVRGCSMSHRTARAGSESPASAAVLLGECRPSLALPQEASSSPGRVPISRRNRSRAGCPSSGATPEVHEQIASLLDAPCAIQVSGSPRICTRRRGAMGVQVGFAGRLRKLLRLRSHGTFDSAPSREVHERSTTGTSRVNERSVETGAVRHAGQGWHSLLSWQGSAREAPQRRQHSSALVQGDTPIPAGFSRLPTDPLGHAWARPPAHQ